MPAASRKKVKREKSFGAVIKTPGERPPRHIGAGCGEIMVMGRQKPPIAPAKPRRLN
jgi:hypothetical protein